jgi:DNA-binding GntR family transcriptional regulator
VTWIEPQKAEPNQKRDTMTAPRAPGLRAQSVYNALRRAIIEQALKPAMKLPEDSIGEQLGVSRTLVREALGRLAVEGLVELKPNRGASVAYPTLEEARDVFDVRRGRERRRRLRSWKPMSARRKWRMAAMGRNRSASPANSTSSSPR